VSCNLSRFGETYLLNLKLIDIGSAEVPARVSRRIKGGEEELLDGLMEATHELFVKVADRLELIPTVTVASRHTQLLAESPSAVTVITRKEILSSGANTLADLLRRVPGFDIYDGSDPRPRIGPVRSQCFRRGGECNHCVEQPGRRRRRHSVFGRAG
jgi:hypothetical protein